MGIRQHHLMNYDTYYGPYGGAGKYLYVQDMAAQTGDIANATFAAFDAITWWNGIGTETVIARQALGRLGLSADEYAFVGMNADEVVRLAKMQQLQERVVVTGGRGTLPHDKALEAFLETMKSQERQNSCVPACVRELLRRQGINMTEEDAIVLIKSDPDGATRYFERVARGFNSRSRLIYTDEIGKFLPEDATFDDAFIAARQWKEPWIARVKPPGFPEGVTHGVIIEGSEIRNGKWWIIVTDPWPWESTVVGKPGPALQYPMTWDSFFQYWRPGQYGGLFPLE